MIKKSEIIFALIIVKHCILNTDTLPVYPVNHYWNGMRQGKIENIVIRVHSAFTIRIFFCIIKSLVKKDDQNYR